MDYTVAVADSNGTVIWSEIYTDGEVEQLFLRDVLMDSALDAPDIPLP